MSDAENIVSLLTEKCGYILSDALQNKVSEFNEAKNDGITSFDFNVSLKFKNKSIHGKISFGCFTASSATSKEQALRRPDAAEEIAQADSGGRYVRRIVWQRKYNGMGWSGTIAYVKSIFGDREKLSVPDYFLICPVTGKFACFSFEVAQERLSRQESDSIPKLLEGIGIQNLSLAVPDSF